VEVNQLDDYFIEISPAVLNKLGWKAGDIQIKDQLCK
tara:strand:- start:191 stop:301 length:111 start_codon:yes stop_codon:yes gene_type:complete